MRTIQTICLAYLVLTAAPLWMVAAVAVPMGLAVVLRYAMR